MPRAKSDHARATIAGARVFAPAVPSGRIGAAVDRDWLAVLDRLLAGDRVAFLEVNRLVTGFLVQLRAYDFREEWDDLRQEVLLSVVANARAGRLRDPKAFVGQKNSRVSAIVASSCAVRPDHRAGSTPGESA